MSDRIQVFDIAPSPYVRQTQADKWKKRKCVQKYWDFKDQVRAAGITIHDGGTHITFVVDFS